MKRRHFLHSALSMSAVVHGGAQQLLESTVSNQSDTPIPKRRYKNHDMLSIIGFGGIVCLDQSSKQCANVIAEAFDRGVNYFDVAPSYGDGEAERKLGPAMEKYRQRAFLACKTMQRDAKGSQQELEQSLQRLRTNHFDLYQFHAVTTLEEVDEIFARGGAIETFRRARDAGQIRYIGFSAHSEEAALEMMERFDFDSILFPFNVVCYSQGKFGPKVLERAKEKGVARLALKALAYSQWRSKAKRTHPKCWYQPITDRELAKQALRFTLSEDVTSALPPGDEELFRLALEIGADFTPMNQQEREELIARTEGVQPLFPLREN
jgi:aryl-alcohol dehydrogenase-like predicted oxidoreductase